MSQISTKSDPRLEPRVTPMVPRPLSTWGAAVPSARPLVERLGSTEVRRRLWHILPGFLPFLLWVIPHQDPWELPLLVVVVLLAVVLVASMLRGFGRIARQGAESGVAPVVGYGATVLAMLLLFPGHAEWGLTVLAVLAFGDGCATLGGKLWQGPKLPWNPQKTWVGFACFCVCGGLMSTVIYWGEARPQYGWAVAAACGVSATLVAALAESLPMRLNDNIRVSLTAAATVVATHVYLLGW